MSGTNTKLAAMAAVMTNPLTFAPTTGQAAATMIVTVNANLDLLIQAISYEETDPTYHRLYLDEMSPVARTSLYKMLTDMKAVSLV